MVITPLFVLLCKLCIYKSSLKDKIRIIETKRLSDTFIYNGGFNFDANEMREDAIKMSTFPERYKIILR